MPSVVADGIETRYEIVGEGAPLLLFSPGGFDAVLDKWRAQSVYARTRMLDHLAAKCRCILFDRRECGQSGGRIEEITWMHYAAQGKALLEQLGVERAHIMGGCMGCSVAAAFAVAYPHAAQSLVLFWPVGGARYRMRGEQRFRQHLDYVAQQGLAGVVSLVAACGATFGADPRVGPWASVIRRDPHFAQTYAAQDPTLYRSLVARMAESLFDRDTAPGAPPEALMRLQLPALVVPGRDESHATSAARYFEECIEGAQYWDVPPESQTQASVAPRLLQFLERR